MNLMQYYGWKSQVMWNADDGAGAGGDPAPATPPADTGAPAEPAAAADYSFLPEQYRSDDGPDIDGFKSHYESLEAAQARWDERQAGIPEAADGYEFALPDIDYKELGLPDDFKLELNPEDEALGPILTELGGTLHKHGIPKDVAPELMGALAKYEALSQKKAIAQAEADRAEQMQALGPKADARIADVQRTIESRLPEAQAKGLMSALYDANAVKALETLLGPRGLGGGNPTPKPRTVDDDVRDYYAKPT